MELLSADIATSRPLTADKVWVVDREVHVLDGVELSIEDGTTILLLNGDVPSSQLGRAALIFDPGSRLSATRFAVRAGSAKHRISHISDNGGLWFLGTHACGASDGLSVSKQVGQSPSLFRALLITASHLGRRDPPVSSPAGWDRDDADDIDAVKLIGVGPDEWQVSQLRSLHSGDDGVDLTNSHIRLHRLEVRQPTEDGVNLSSSSIEVYRRLWLDVEKTAECDRALFDFETDDGGCLVELARSCWVRLNGVFGDQLCLSSQDMPAPVVTDDNEVSYLFSGRLKADALVYSLSQD
ncbi:MAG: hypothetical protein ACKO8I_04535 [Cyanobacteriota bacterium]